MRNKIAAIYKYYTSKTTGIHMKHLHHFYTLLTIGTTVSLFFSNAVGMHELGNFVFFLQDRNKPCKEILINAIDRQDSEHVHGLLTYYTSTPAYQLESQDMLTRTDLQTICKHAKQQEDLSVASLMSFLAWKNDARAIRQEIDKTLPAIVQKMEERQKLIETK
jgi:hypothetical protein